MRIYGTVLAVLACASLTALSLVSCTSAPSQSVPSASGVSAAGNGVKANQTNDHPIDTHGVTRKWIDVPYASASSAQKLDIYLPDTGSAPYPVIVAVHGGGFATGDKNSGEVNCELDGLTRGYAVVCVNYRLSGEAVFPAQIYDLKAAIRFIKANSAVYSLNADRIAIWGDSAGGNLASMIGTTAGVAELEDLRMGNADQSSDVRAVVDFFGPTDFAKMDGQFAASGVKPFMQHSTADSSESKYLGVQVTQAPDKVKKANPETYISGRTVPFFIENGTNDQIVPTRQSADFADALAKSIGKDKVAYVLLQGAGHGGPQFETKENLDRVFAFLDLYLR